MSNKKKLEAYGIVTLSKNCSAIIQHKLQEKLKDSSSFTITCVMGKHTFSKALCDLGVSINLMPYSVAKKLNLGEITPTALSLQMANRSMASPKGIIEDVLIKVCKFIVPIDFVVLDMEEDEKVPLIFRRPFLARSQALIDVESRELTFKVRDDKVQLSIYKKATMKSLSDHS